MQLEKLGITALNAMQQQAGKAILHSHHDVVVLSPTGTGKTLAYLLPITQMIDAQHNDVQALVVVPGRELALQSHRVLLSMGSGLRSAACYGGRAAMDEHKILNKVHPHVIFGTPGRLNDHLSKGNISPYGVRILVIDEFDKCLEMGFHDEMTRLLGRLPGVRQRILLSATDAEQIPHFVKTDNMVRVDYLPQEEQLSTRVTLYDVPSPTKDKLNILRQLLYAQGGRQTIVFLSFRDAVERVGTYLQRHGFYVSIFHGGLEQKQREDAIYKFSNGSVNILVCTDLASRGLDIPDIGNVIHYHLPQNEQELIHRVGRTARWDKAGRTYFIVGPEEQMPPFVSANVEHYTPPPTTPQQPLPPTMSTIYIGKGKKDKLSKGDILGFLCKKGGLQPTDVGRIDVMDRYTYAAVSRTKVEQVLQQVQGQKIKGIKTVVETVK